MAKESSSMTDGTARVSISERQVPVMLDQVMEGEYWYCKQGGAHARTQHLEIIITYFAHCNNGETKVNYNHVMFHFQFQTYLPTGDFC